MLGFKIIRTRRLNGLLLEKKLSDSAIPRLRDQIAGLRESLNDTITSKREVESKLTQALADLSAATQELAKWRANGQLRDPKTGRLIPKAKGAAQ